MHLNTTLVYIIILIVILYGITSVNIENFGQKMVRKCSHIDNRCYQIQEKYDERTHGGAADILASLNLKNLQLISYLKNKYIDREAYTKLTMPSRNFNMRKKMALNLIKRYNPNVIREHDPKGKKNVSYAWKKGEEIGYCLRERESGNYNLHDIDLLFFVNLHEISHLASTGYDTNHENGFWFNFKIILDEAINAGIYNPINFRKTPYRYCGIDIKYNPHFDNGLDTKFE